MHAEDGQAGGLASAIGAHRTQGREAYKYVSPLHERTHILASRQNKKTSYSITGLEVGDTELESVTFTMST